MIVGAPSVATVATATRSGELYPMTGLKMKPHNLIWKEIYRYVRVRRSSSFIALSLVEYHRSKIFWIVGCVLCGGVG